MIIKNQHFKKEKIESMIFKYIRKFILYDTNDKRLKNNINITHVKTNINYQLATIYFLTTIKDKTKIKKINIIINKATNFYRYLLSKKLKIKKIPHLIFKYDVINIKNSKLYKKIKKL